MSTELNNGSPKSAYGGKIFGVDSYGSAGYFDSFIEKFPGALFSRLRSFMSAVSGSQARFRDASYDIT